MAIGDFAQDSGTFFKPKDFTDAAVLVLKCLEILKDQSYVPYKEKEAKLRDEAIVDLYVFRTANDLSNESPEVHPAVKVTHSTLVKLLRGNEGNVLPPCRVGKPDGKNYFLWLKLQPGTPGFAEAMKFAEKVDSGAVTAEESPLGDSEDESPW